MGQQPAKTFPPPGEYRGIGADGGAVGATQPMANANSISMNPLPQTPMIQSPNSTSTTQAQAQPSVINANGVANPAPTTTTLVKPPIKSTIGSIGV